MQVANLQQVLVTNSGSCAITVCFEQHFTVIITNAIYVNLQRLVECSVRVEPVELYSWQLDS